MEAEYKDGKKLTDDNITGMLLGVLFAGQHTSSITTTWLSLQISSRPDLFEKVMAEQQEALGEPREAAPLTDECYCMMYCPGRCHRIPRVFCFFLHPFTPSPVHHHTSTSAGSSSYSSSPKDNSNLNYDTVGKMDLLHLAMKEVLRMYPPLIMLMRKVSIPINVCNKYTVPVGEQIGRCRCAAATRPGIARCSGELVQREILIVLHTRIILAPIPRPDPVP